MYSTEKISTYLGATIIELDVAQGFQGCGIAHAASGVHFAVFANLVALFARFERWEQECLARPAHKLALEFLKQAGSFVFGKFGVLLSSVHRTDKRIRFQTSCHRYSLDSVPGTDGRNGSVRTGGGREPKI